MKRQERAFLVVEELAKDDDKEVIYAQVDVASAPKLAKRFGPDVLLPCIVLLRDRQMYVFDESFDVPDIADRVREFVISGFEAVTPQDVPAVRDMQLNMDALTTPADVNWQTIGGAVLLILGGLIFQTWAVVNRHKFKPEGPAQATGAGAAKAGEKEGEKAAGAGKAAAGSPQAAKAKGKAK